MTTPPPAVPPTVAVPAPAAAPNGDAPAASGGSDASGPTIPATEYADRRNALCERLGDSIAVVYAGDRPTEDDWRPHAHFEYLTGIADEPGAVLVLDPMHPVASRRHTLFLRPLDPELEQWDGLRDPIASALRERYGMTAIHRLGRLGRHLSEAVPRAGSLTCVHPLANFDQPVSPDLDLFHKLQARVPGLTIRDGSGLVPALRAVKSDAEIAMVRRAAEITAVGYEDALRLTKPGISEFDVQEALEHGYRRSGSRGPAYGTIAGSAINSCVLHYRANDRTIQDGDIICIDSGASYRSYGADVTRTIPASGRFTDRQREIHDIVLASLEAGIAAVKPGATLSEIDTAARAVIVKAGYGDAFIHSIGHHLGLETHDTCGNGPLAEGAVITVEPGIYLPDEAIGVRIEDDVVVTKDGCDNLTRMIPRSADEIEAAMARG